MSTNEGTSADCDCSNPFKKGNVNWTNAYIQSIEWILRQPLRGNAEWLQDVDGHRKERIFSEMITARDHIKPYNYNQFNCFICALTFMLAFQVRDMEIYDQGIEMELFSLLSKAWRSTIYWLHIHIMHVIWLISDMSALSCF